MNVREDFFRAVTRHNHKSSDMVSIKIKNHGLKNFIVKSYK